MTELWKLGAAEAAEKIRSKQIKPSELVESVLDRVDTTNPNLNAIVLSHADNARRQALMADEAVVSGSELGPLHGIPITIKHNVDMAGDPNPNGVPAFANLMADENCPLADRLHEAGGIVIGRTNTPEFSMRGTTDNPLHGRTINPWEEQLSPGGSSGGAGVAAVAGMGPIHHGNDIGGSLRFPSHANGVMTVKPSSYRVPVYNSSAPVERSPLAGEISCQGVITRHARDIRLATEIMVRPDPRDPISPPVPFYGPDLNNRKVALTRESHGYDLHPGLHEQLDNTAEQLSDAGYDVIEVETPSIADAAAGWFSALTTELRLTAFEAVQQYGSETIINIFGWYFDMSELLDLDGYIRASAHRTALKRDWSRFLCEYPLVLSPFLMAPFYDWDYDARGPAEAKDIFDSAIWSTGINYLGLPAGVIGTGMVENRPAAVQIIGQRWREDLICDALEAVENRNGILAPDLWAREK